MLKTLIITATFGILVGTMIVLGMVIPGEVVLGTYIAIFGITCFVSGGVTTLGIVHFTKRNNDDPAKISPAPQPSILVMGGQPMPYPSPQNNYPPVLPERSGPRQFNVIGDDD